MDNVLNMQQCVFFTLVNSFIILRKLIQRISAL